MEDDTTTKRRELWLGLNGRIDAVVVDDEMNEARARGALGKQTTQLAVERCVLAGGARRTAASGAREPARDACGPAGSR